MKTVLLLGGPAAGQRVEVHGAMTSYRAAYGDPGIGFFAMYNVVPMCSHGEVHWFGVLDGADPLALLIAGYGGSTETDLVVDLVHAVKSLIAGTNGEEKFVGHNAAYLHSVAMPRAVAALARAGVKP